MMYLKRFLVGCMFLIGISGYAQERQGRGNMQNMDPAERAKNTLMRLTEQLQLEKSQQDSIYKQLLQQAQEEKIMFSNMGDDREKARNAMQASRKKYSGKIKNFLNAEQAKKYEELQQQWSQRRARQNQ